MTCYRFDSLQLRNMDSLLLYTYDMLTFSFDKEQFVCVLDFSWMQYKQELLSDMKKLMLQLLPLISTELLQRCRSLIVIDPQLCAQYVIDDTMLRLIETLVKKIRYVRCNKTFDKYVKNKSVQLTEITNLAFPLYYESKDDIRFVYHYFSDK